MSFGTSFFLRYCSEQEGYSLLDSGSRGISVSLPNINLEGFGHKSVALETSFLANARDPASFASLSPAMPDNILRTFAKATASQAINMA